MIHPAYEIAAELKTSLAPACVRVEIAGSVRRQKLEPHDIEIVCRPSIGIWSMRDMFDELVDTREVNYLDDLLVKLYESFVWRLDVDNPKDGKNYKRLKHLESGICCDLFIVTDPRKWGLIYTIRTGSADFSKFVVTHARNCGWFVQHGLLHQHLADTNKLGEVQECPDGETCPHIAPTLEEKDVFDVLGIPWIEPIDRTTISQAMARIEYRNHKALETR